MMCFCQTKAPRRRIAVQKDLVSYGEVTFSNDDTSKDTSQTSSDPWPDLHHLGCGNSSSICKRTPTFIEISS